MHRASFGRHLPAFCGPLRSTRSPSLTPHYRGPHRYYDPICRPGLLGSPLSVRLPPPSLGPSPPRTSPRGHPPRLAADGPRASQDHHESPIRPCPPHARRRRTPRSTSPNQERVALPRRRWTRFALAWAWTLALGALQIRRFHRHPALCYRIHVASASSACLMPLWSSWLPGVPRVWRFERVRGGGQYVNRHLVSVGGPIAGHKYSGVVPSFGCGVSRVPPRSGVELQHAANDPWER